MINGRSGSVYLSGRGSLCEAESQREPLAEYTSINLEMIQPFTSSSELI